MPSFTEDLCAIGAVHQIVGVSEYSQDIPCVRGLPEVSNYAGVDTERILQLHPDAIVGIPSERSMTAPLARAGVRMQFYRDYSFADLFTDIRSLGALTGRSAQAEHVISSLHAQTAALQRSAHFQRRPNVFFVAQAQPLWTIGPSSYIASLIALAGGRLATASLRQPYAQYSTEALLAADPDAIVATSDARLQDVLSREPWRSLRAVRFHHVFILQNASLLARPGPRYNEGLRWLIARFSSL